MFGRVQVIVVCTILFFGAISGIYYKWRSGIEREALLEYNQQQLEQSIKDKEEMQKQLHEIDEAKRVIEERNAADKKVFKDKLDSIAVELNSKQVILDNREASKVLKDTVNKLKDVVK